MFSSRLCYHNNSAIELFKGCVLYHRVIEPHSLSVMYMQLQVIEVLNTAKESWCHKLNINTW